jgi:hypothetical protein
MPLGSVDDVRMHIRNIEGIGPVKSEIAMAPFALARGEFDQGSSTGSRNIVLNLGMNPLLSAGETMTALRHQVYRYFMPEIKVTLTFSSDELPDVYIDGVVESLEPNIFSQDPEMQISIICARPDFIDPTEQTVGPNNADDYSTEIEYSGSVSTGFVAEIHNTSAIYNGDLEVKNENGPFKFDLIANGLTINSDRFFRLITVPTNRRLQYVDESSGDVGSSLMGRMWKGSSWPELMPGTNDFRIIAEPTGPQWTLTYHNRYGGL